MRRLTAVLACAALALAACGDDDDDAAGDGGGGGDLQNEVADKLLDEEGDEFQLDDDCVREKAAQLSDDDAQAILDAEGDEDPDLSPEGIALTAELLSCADADAMIDQLVEQLPEGIDADCVREALDGVDLGDFASGGEPPSEFVDAMTECVQTG
jgi:hypothetical protein